MARGKKDRFACLRFPCREFIARPAEKSPETSPAPAVELAVDELEALRLTDLEELTQADAAGRMGISRGTLQRLLWGARRKITFALLAGRSLLLQNGEKFPPDGCEKKEKCRFCHYKLGSLRSLEGKEHNMKIAVTCENDEVFQHFGHTPEFAVFSVENGKIVNTEKIPTGETGHGALAGFLREKGVELLLCGGIGGGAQMALAEAGIKLVGGVSGNVTEAVEQYLAGSLTANPDFACHHHDHEAGHACGAHGCGGHSCH